MKKTAYPRVLRTKEIYSDRVRNAAGEDLGKIEELVIDVNTGRVAYAVLSFGGVLKMGNKLFAIPLLIGRGWYRLNAPGTTPLGRSRSTRRVKRERLSSMS